MRTRRGLRHSRLTLTAWFVGVSLVGAADVRAQAPNPDVLYQLGPDSLEQVGVPKGEIRGPFTLPSTAYPGTQHTYWVYVPAQYNGLEPVSLMVFNDGQAFKNPTGNVRAYNVLDNLIYRREVPVMILPEMMRWLWRDQPVSTDPRDTVERSFRAPATQAPTTQN